jgi:hypothetical protein
LPRFSTHVFFFSFLSITWAWDRKQNQEAQFSQLVPLCVSSIDLSPLTCAATHVVMGAHAKLSIGVIAFYDAISRLDGQLLLLLLACGSGGKTKWLFVGFRRQFVSPQRSSVLRNQFRDDWKEE